MPLTGRQRAITVTAHAEEKRSIDNPANYSADTQDASSVSGWGLTAGCTTSFTYVETFDPVRGDPGPVVVTTTITPKLTVAGNLPWGGTYSQVWNGGVVILQHTVPAGFDWSLYNTLYPTNGIQIRESSAYVDATAGLLMLENDLANPVSSAPAARRERVGAGSTLTVQGAASYTFIRRINNGIGPQPTGTGNASGFQSYTAGAAGADQLSAFYRHTLSFNGRCKQGVRATFQASGSGIQYSAGRVDAASGAMSLTGTVNDCSFGKTNSGIGQASVTASPDWAYQFDARVYWYDDGLPLLGVGLIHRYIGVNATEKIGAWSTGSTYRFPAAPNFRYYKVVTLWDGTLSNPQQKPYDLPLDIHHCGTTAANSNGSSYVLTDAAWGDANGILLDSITTQNNGRYWEWSYSPAFTVATLRIASTHRYRWSTSPSRWRNPNTFGPGSDAVVVDDAGVTKLVAGPSSTNFFMPYNGAGTAAVLFRPAAYRYHRIRLKAAVAGTVVSLRVSTQTGASSSNGAGWNLTLGTSWADYEFDLVFPDVIISGSGFVPWEPYRYATAANSAQLNANLILSLPANAVVWVEYVEGYHKTDGARIPALLVAPLLKNAAGSSDTGWDHPNTSANKFLIGGPDWGRLFSNGILTAQLTGVSGDIRNTWSTQYVPRIADDGADVDTGITVTLAASPSPYTVLTDPRNGYSLESNHQLWQSYPLDTDHTIRGQERGPIGGYYGMGDPSAESYDPVLTFHGEQVVRGEILGLAYHNNASAPGATLARHDDDTGAALNAATADDDGLYRLMGKYGAILPWDNSSEDPNDNARKLYSGTYPSTLVYTTKGKTFNAYWVTGSNLSPVDGSGYATDPAFPAVRGRFPIMDRWPAVRHFTAWPDSNTHVDLAALPSGWLVRAWIAGGQVRVERSLDAGATWRDAVTVATDAATTDGGAAPALLAREEELFLWYHTSGGAAQGYYSEDGGATWTALATHAGLKFPRAARRGDLTFLAAHDGTALQVYRSADAGVTLGSAVGTISDALLGLAALRVGRDDQLRVVYQATGSALRQRSSRNGATWSSATTLATGTYPAYALGAERGLLVYRSGSVLAATTDETGAGTLTAGGALTHSYAAGYLGAVWTEREHAYISGFVSGRIETDYSRNAGVTWQAPA